MPSHCAIMLPTRNRCADLRRTLEVVAQLDPPADEIIVTADACSDGTVEFIRTEHPGCRLVINQTPLGSIAARAAMLRAAASEFVLSIDDDSYPLEKDALARLVTLFAKYPRLAVASFPQRTDEQPESLTATDFGPALFVASYVNCACAFRRSACLEVGGVFTPFWHAYDEPDLTLRFAAAGWQVRHDPCLTIRHHFSGQNRNEMRVHHLHARNEIWSVLLRCPAPQFAAVALFRMMRQFGYAAHRGLPWVLHEPQWWWAALRGVSDIWRQRAPIPWPQYSAWMRLMRRPVESEAAWKALFGSSTP